MSTFEYVTKFLDEQPASALEGVQAYLIFSAVEVELRLRSSANAYRPGRYHETLHRLITHEETARDEALLAARAGEHERCVQIAEAAQSPLLRVFRTQDEALAHVNSELRKLEGTRFNDVYTESRFEAVVHVGIYIEAS